MTSSAWPTVTSGWIRTGGLIASFVIVAAACSSGSTARSEAAGSGKPSTTTTAPGSTSAVPASDAAPRENVAFFYQGINRDTDFSRLGQTAVVVTGKAAPAYAPEMIHRTGAKAYRGFQAYWFSAGDSYDGLEIPKRIDWAFCLQGSTPLVARTDARGNAWHFVDGNERGVQDALAARLLTLKAEGWDGIFFDRGYAAMTGLDDQANPAWNAVSTCTQDAVVPNLTLSDSYLTLASAVRKVGLEVMVNYGVSPFDAKTPMRPDPRSPACAPHPVPGCPTLDDVWPITDWILDEAVAHTEDVEWDNDFRSNQQNEVQAKLGRRVMGLITNSNLGGRQDRDSAVFAFARVKLFAIPVGINTGDDNCPGAPPGGLCNRHGVYPELVGLRLGDPVDPNPVRSGCESASTVHCLWSRRYVNGASIVNVSATTKSLAKFALGVDGCRYVQDLGTQRPLESNRCVSEVALIAPPWSGHPLAYSRKPW